jgi:hypothetical protein
MQRAEIPVEPGEGEVILVLFQNMGMVHNL